MSSALRHPKFRYGDLVSISKRLPPEMAHFTKGVNAIILSTYSSTPWDTSAEEEIEYCIFLEEEGETSWYPEGTLTLVRTHDLKTLNRWIRGLE